jgi:hypothetical protein
LNILLFCCLSRWNRASTDNLGDGSGEVLLAWEVRFVRFFEDIGEFARAFGGADDFISLAANDLAFRDAVMEPRSETREWRSFDRFAITEFHDRSGFFLLVVSHGRSWTGTAINTVD